MADQWSGQSGACTVKGVIDYLDLWINAQERGLKPPLLPTDEGLPGSQRSYLIEIAHVLKVPLRWNTEASLEFPANYFAAFGLAPWAMDWLELPCPSWICHRQTSDRQSLTWLRYIQSVARCRATMLHCSSDHANDLAQDAALACCEELVRLDVLLRLLLQGPPSSTMINRTIYCALWRGLARSNEAGRKRWQRGQEIIEMEYAAKHIGLLVDERLERKTLNASRDIVIPRILVETHRRLRRLIGPNWAENRGERNHNLIIEQTIDKTIAHVLGRRKVRPIGPAHGREIHPLELCPARYPRTAALEEVVRDAVGTCTPRQRRIWERRAEGESVSKIARDLHLTTSVVNRELQQIKALVLDSWQNSEVIQPPRS